MVTHRDPGNGPEDRTPPTGRLTVTTGPLAGSQGSWEPPVMGERSADRGGARRGRMAQGVAVLVGAGALVACAAAPASRAATVPQATSPAPTTSVVPTSTVVPTTSTPPAPVTPARPGHTLGVLTADGSPLYRVATAGRVLQVTAPDAGTVVPASGNLRMAIVDDAADVSVDQRSCVSWGALRGAWDQPGLALRVRTEGSRTRAIVVTNNVMFLARWTFNVHLADSAADEPMPLIGRVALGASMSDPSGGLAPYPWRLCARVRGTTLELKAWSLVDTPTEPAWGDPDHSDTVEVPAAWVAAGRPGVYVGHLAIGTTLDLTDPVTASLSPPP